MQCPTCQKEFVVEESTALPFCSPRCKQIDMGRWLGERIHMPIERVPSDDEAQDDSVEND
jgi:endogenous inhibitor of DNA gyrase (YacG/DUF329 family)